MLSEVDRRIAETKKDMYEFKRDVIGELASQTCLYSCLLPRECVLAALLCSVHIAVGAENARTGKTMAEKMVKIMEERLKEKAAVTEKLHSKNHALKV